MSVHGRSRIINATTTASYGYFLVVRMNVSFHYQYPSVIPSLKYGLKSGVLSFNVRTGATTKIQTYTRLIESKKSELFLVALILSSKNAMASISSIGCSNLRNTQIFCSTSGGISNSSRRVPDRLTLIAG